MSNTLWGAELLRLAETIAEEAHRGALYDPGVPYIVHPRGVAELARKAGYNEETQAGCMLHDVIEDSRLTIADLHDVGIPLFVAEGVWAVSFRGHDDKAKLEKASSHPLGHVIKVFDAEFNLGSALRAQQREERRIHRYTGFVAGLKDTMPSPETIAELTAEAQDYEHHIDSLTTMDTQVRLDRMAVPL